MACACASFPRTNRGVLDLGPRTSRPSHLPLLLQELTHVLRKGGDRSPSAKVGRVIDEVRRVRGAETRQGRGWIAVRWAGDV
eukprot:scaffold649_cov347-Pavlova_lutheri.AAC.117